MLEYFSLGMLIMGLTMAIYVFVYIHGIPHSVAKKRKHPQAEAIRVACWLSLFTLHALWPLVFIWAMSNQETLISGSKSEQELRDKVSELQERLDKLESATS